MSEDARMLNNNLILLHPVSLRLQFPIFGNSVKKNLHYFRKILYHRRLTGLWTCLRSWMYQDFEYASGSKYARVLYMPGFWIYQGSQNAKVLNIPGFWICQSSKYVRVLTIPGLHSLLNVSEYPWIILECIWLCLNMPECSRIIRPSCYWSRKGRNFPYLKTV